MVVIAGQELGHFADLRRRGGAILGRHSTDAAHSQLRANLDRRRRPPVRPAPRRSARPCLCRERPARPAPRRERRRLLPQTAALFATLAVPSATPLRCLVTFHPHRRGRNLHHIFHTEPYHRLGEAIALYLADMAFNLAPDADAYRHPDPLVEEAIAVIEAVARVPQQVHKWGHGLVAAAWPGLYAFYYGTVIPGVAQVVKTPLQRQKTQ